MKLIAGIMALVVLLLSVQPALAMLATEQETECSGGCCKKETTPEKEQHGDEDCAQNCNPLLSCGNCSACPVDFIVLSIDYPHTNSTQPVPFSQQVYSQFSPDFWQPPKLA